jgi:hypothetical protein
VLVPAATPATALSGCDSVPCSANRPEPWSSCMLQGACFCGRVGNPATHQGRAGTHMLAHVGCMLGIRMHTCVRAHADAHCMQLHHTQTRAPLCPHNHRQVSPRDVAERIMALRQHIAAEMSEGLGRVGEANAAVRRR